MNQENSFLTAVKNGDVSTVLRLANISKNERSRTAENSTNSLYNESLISTGDDNKEFNVSFSDWPEAVWVAETKSHSDIKKLLFEFDSIVKAVTKDGWTVFHRVVGYDFPNRLNFYQPSMISILLESGKFDVNALTLNSQNALHLLCSYPSYKSRCDEHTALKITDILIEQNININHRDVEGRTAMLLACENRYTAVATVLLEMNLLNDNILEIGFVEVMTEKGLQVLHTVITSNIPARIRFYELLLAEFLLNSDKFDENSLTLAVFDLLQSIEGRGEREKSIEFTQNPRYCKENDTLRLACLSEYTTLANTLKNIDVTEQTNKSFVDQLNIARSQLNSLLHSTYKYLLNTCKYSHIDSVMNIDNFAKKIIEYKKQSSSKERKTLLMVACEMGNIEIVRYLLDWMKIIRNWNDIKAYNRSHETALMIAKRKNHSDIVSLLMEAEFVRAIVDKEVEETEDSKHLAFQAQFSASIRTGDKYLAENLMLLSQLNYERCAETLSPVLYSILSFDWFLAVLKANKDFNKDILNLLFDIEPFVQRGSKRRETILHLALNNYTSQRHNSKRRTLENLEIIKILVKSGKFDVNALDFSSKTLLHCAIEDCDSGYCNSGEEDDDIIGFLLDHKVDVNHRDTKGCTVLMYACAKGCVSAVRVLLEWSSQTKASLDFDARDIFGRTALMKAAQFKHSKIVALLLNNENCRLSINESDYKGFTALHYALHEHFSPSSWVIHGDIPEDLEELRTRINSQYFETEETHEFYRRSRTQLNKDKDETVKLLLQVNNLDVNALDIEGNTPIDVAIISTAEILPTTLDVLGQNGAVAYAFERLTEFGNVGLILNLSIGLRGGNMLHRFAIVSGMFDAGWDSDLKTFKNLKEKMEKKLSELNEDKRRKMISEKDVKGRTALHYAVIQPPFEPFSATTQDAFDICSSGAKMVEIYTKYGGNVNEIDKYGRTPMHYFISGKTMRLLQKHCADATIKDIYGVSAEEMITVMNEQTDTYLRNCSREFVYKTVLGRLLKEKIDDRQRTFLHRINGTLQLSELCSEKLNTDKMWTDLKYAYRNSVTNEINEKVVKCMRELANAIESKDPRFSSRLEFVGSSSEGTKLNYPDEFDFKFCLTKFSQICEVEQSSNLPKGFVYLKRKETISGVSDGDNFDCFFDKSGILIIEKVNAKFKLILGNVLLDSKFIERQHEFDWDYRLQSDELGTLYHKQCRISTFTMALVNPKIGDEFMTRRISVDIVASIQIEVWWPDGSLSDVSSEIKHFGCTIIHDRPQKILPTMPFSDHCAMISFAVAESRKIRSAPDAAKEAYMIAKHLIKTVNSFYNMLNPFVLKTSLLYCIEAFTSKTKAQDLSGTSHSSSCDDRMNRGFWLENLMRCYLNFYIQDFLPCYFLPSFSLPTSTVLRFNHLLLSEFQSTGILFALEELEIVHLLYNCVCSRGREVNLRLPIENVVCEEFDREKFIGDLKETAMIEL